MRNTLKVATSLSLAFVVTAALGQVTPIVRISGSIEKVEGNILSIKSSDGETFTLKLDNNYSTAVVSKASLADIKPNSYVGTAALPMPDGRLRALEVHIFSEDLRGMGEGSHATDLQPGSTMTNAAVAGNVEVADGRVLTLTYKGGEKKVFVPPNAPIAWYESGTKDDVKLGAGIKVRAEKLPDGSFKANSITVGRNGFNPP